MRRRSQLGLAAALAVTFGLQSSGGAPLPEGLVAAYYWTIDDARFGGLSAIEMDDDGVAFTALSDKGTLFRGYLTRDSDDRITQIRDVVATTLKGRDQAPLEPHRNDSEGLAIAPDGTIFVSLEGPARVLRYAGPDSSAVNLPSFAPFTGMQPNASLEPLAIDANGALYTLPERSGRLDAPFPVYRYRIGAWDQPFTLPRAGMYLPTAADIGPDGRLYLLERQFHGLLGFQSRVRRFVIEGDMVDTGETVLETAIGQHGNQEGLSVWRDATGVLRLTMISDDNFRFFLSTAIVEYRIAD